MGKFEGYLLLSDFDGTLYNAKLGVTRENADAIRYFQSEGGLFALASGRIPTWLLEWKDAFLPNTYSAMINGAILCDANGKNYQFDRPIHDDFLEKAEQILAACPNYNSFSVASDCEYVKFERGDVPDRARIPDRVYKMVFRVPEEESDVYMKRIRSIVDERYLVVRSWINGIEVQNAETGKGKALLRLKSMLGERARTVVAVGDYENDLDMIRAADIGYAVENASPALKAIADRITVDCQQSAIAAIVAELEKQR